MNKSILIVVFVILTLLFSVAFSYSRHEEKTITFASTSSDMADINLRANVFVSKNGVLIYEGHNVLTNAGADHIKLCLGTDGGCGSDGFISIAVGNGTAPASGSTTLNSEIAESGLERADGTYASTGTGAWKVEKVFSVTGTVGSVNSTGLFNASSSGTMLAGDTFTNTNVASGDSLISF